MPQTVALRENQPEITETQDIRAESDEAFLARARPDLEILEQLRLVKLKTYQFRKKIGIPLAVFISPVFGWIDYWLLSIQTGDDKGAGLSLVFLGALYWWVTQPRRQYAAEYKKKILPQIAKLFGALSYDIKGRIDMAAMEPSKIIPYHDLYSAEDYFSGIYKGVEIEFSEITLQKKKRDKDGDTHYITVFKGLAILLAMKNRRFYGHTILDRERSKLGEWFWQKSKSFKRADLVDPEFEKIFDVFTNDQVEARYLIDPVMIEQLKGLYAEYEGERMYAAFYDSKMLILIASKHNHFEPAKLEIPATDPQNILSMKKEVGEILSIIDKLDLYDPAEVERLRASPA